MASKSKFSIEPARAEQRQEGGAAFADASGHSSTRRLVSGIAQALQIPEAAFYDVPNAVVPSLRMGGTKDRLDVECAALLMAYRRIDDSALRHGLLNLVQEAAR